MEFLLESLVIHHLSDGRARNGILAVVSLAAASMVGCANHNDRSAGYLNALEAGRWDSAVSAARRAAAGGPERNAVIDALELGAVENIAGQWKQSDASLGRAWDLMEAQGEPGDPTFMQNLALILTGLSGKWDMSLIRNPRMSRCPTQGVPWTCSSRHR